MSSACSCADNSIVTQITFCSVKLMGWGGSLINIQPLASFLFFYIKLFSKICRKASINSFFSVFPEVADEPAPEKPAAEKQGSSNDRGNN